MTPKMQSVVSAFVGGFPPPRLAGCQLSSQERARRVMIRLVWHTALIHGRGLALGASTQMRWRRIMVREELLVKLRREWSRCIAQVVQDDARWATVVGLCARAVGTRRAAKRRARLAREVGLECDEEPAPATNTKRRGRQPS